jgi:hypothetical protein
MNPDNFKDAWQAQTSKTRLTIDSELLMKEVRRNENYFNAMILWRDVREVGVALLLVPLWLYLGSRLSMPWTWYLMVPALLWIAGFMLVDRQRHHRRPPEPGVPLRERVARSLAEVEHQIRLLRNIFWWYLLPVLLPMPAFCGQVAWQGRAGGWWGALGLTIVAAFVAIVFVGVYRLNQNAVRCELEPRRQELQALLISLGDEPPASIY